MIRYVLSIYVGGQFKFPDSWAKRVWVRHDLPFHITTTKMRKLLADYHDVLLETYVRTGAALIHKYKVPRGFFYGVDETAAQFVPEARGTRSKRGEKRVATKNHR